ncbi:MAG: LamB/YcsF family protein [Acidobacteria bacterium]|nr:MAG: LamB/YcsF family protein [Acidobacteriota bacterium]
MRTIDLNADLGELPGAASLDAALMEHLTSVNVACGGHAGDEGTMEVTVRAALARGLAVGAHPSYPDREGFGRKPRSLGPEEVAAAVEEQVRALSRVVLSCGGSLGHVKPHGALYNVAARDEAVARAVAEGVGRVSRDVVLVGLSGSRCLEVYRAAGFVVAAEAFADRRYEPDGSLTPRSLPGALVEEPETAARQAVSIAVEGTVLSRGGLHVAVPAETICLHGDTPGALEIARRVATRLREAGVTLARLAPR